VEQRHFSRGHDLHVRVILFEVQCPHTLTDYIDEGRHSSPRSINNSMFEVREISPPRAPGIGDRGNSHAEGEAVGINAVISGKGSSLARPRIDMNVNVY
jgi:hypothetical protein